MTYMHETPSHMSPLILLLLFSSLTDGSSGYAAADAGGRNPFTPKAFLIRYWDKKIGNNLPKPQFLLSKASPLTAVETAAFAKLAAQHALSDHLSQFCSSAHLLCFHPVFSSPSLAKHNKDSNFAVYNNKNFTNYGTGRLGGVDSFRNYSDSGRENIPIDDFRRYSGRSSEHRDNFFSYGSGGNIIDQSFHIYAAGATGGSGDFNNYADPAFGTDDLQFNSYSDDAKRRSQTFNSYTENGNGGIQSFTSYGKRGNEAKSEFASYGTSSNMVVNGFSNYGEDAIAANDTFKNYENHVNDPTNNFENYGNGGNGSTDGFATYRDDGNGGSDSFQSYAKGSNSANVDFASYDLSVNSNSDKFSGYGKGAENPKVGFDSYRVNSTFKDYAKQGFTFAKYHNGNSVNSSMAASGSLVKRRVEPGKFFRESMLKEGTVMPMPDIRDKMPERSFLPRAILSRIPFTVSEVKVAFKVGNNTSMEKIVMESVSECERAPSQGETKRCVGSIEDMVDFAIGVLRRNVMVRTTENVNGSKKSVMVGSVKGINGGGVTQSVSCHQSLFPYLLYYCHSVPKVRVYEADLLDPNSKIKINHGVAICHLDTSAWSPGHGAFLALGSGPGRIEVCHWIFENDMTWVTAD